MIKLKTVSMWYGGFQVLNDCSTPIKKGEVVVICGPSELGKSTLIKTINALEPIQAGQIIVDNAHLNDPKTKLPQRRAKVGMVFQHFIEDCSKDEFFGNINHRSDRAKYFISKIS